MRGAYVCGCLSRACDFVDCPRIRDRSATARNCADSPVGLTHTTLPCDVIAMVYCACRRAYDAADIIVACDNSADIFAIRNRRLCRAYDTANIACAADRSAICAIRNSAVDEISRNAADIVIIRGVIQIIISDRRYIYIVFAVRNADVVAIAQNSADVIVICVDCARYFQEGNTCILCITEQSAIIGFLIYIDIQHSHRIGVVEIAAVSAADIARKVIARIKSDRG